MTFRNAVRTLNQMAQTDPEAKRLADRLALLNERPSLGDYDAAADEALAYVESQGVVVLDYQAKARTWSEVVRRRPPGCTLAELIEQVRQGDVVVDPSEWVREHA
jgi:hypothetical protein